MTKQAKPVEISVGDRRLEIAEKIAVGLSFGGSIVGFIFQKYFIVCAPISCALGLNLINRQKMLASIAQSNSIQIEALSHKHESHVTTTTNMREKQVKLFKDMEKSQVELRQKLDCAQSEIQQLESSLRDVNQVSEDLDNSLTQLHKHQSDIDTVVQELRVLGNSDDKESDDESPANFYCKRGLIYHKRHKYQQALKDFNTAMQLDDNFAPAYHHSGLTHLNIGNKHKAFENLRKAAKLYFANDDLEKYHQVRKLSQKLYHNDDTLQETIDSDDSAATKTAEQKIGVDDLFA